MQMATRKKTDAVLAAARKEMQAQLAVVREEMSRLASEERALAQALSSIDGPSGAGSSAKAPASAETASGSPAKQARRKSPTRKAGTGRRRRARASKSSAERLEELKGLLVDGPRSRNDLAAALKVSPARVQQLLAELGGAVSSEPDPGRSQGKLWSLNGSADRKSAVKPATKGSGARASSASARKRSARRKAAAK